MITFPNAKINLGLAITEKRPDGFHNLETCFYPIGLSDILEITLAKKDAFRQTGLNIPGNLSDNLCLKAIKILREHYDFQSVSIHLHKIIPFGAGLGGGSSDGAFTLKMIDELFDLKISEDRLLHFSEKLGSDCPFFIKNSPALGSGKGEILRPATLDLGRYQLAIVKPSFSISTAEAYGLISPKFPSISLAETIGLKIEHWRDMLQNDFQAPLEERYIDLKMISNKLYDLGALYASMSGSGSAYFALFETVPSELRNAFTSDYFIWSSQEF